MGEGHALFGVDEFELAVDGGLLVGHFEVDESGFDGDGAIEAPLGGGHAFDEKDLDGSGGLEAVNEGLADIVVIGLRFIIQNNFARGKSVGERVPG